MPELSAIQAAAERELTVTVNGRSFVVAYAPARFTPEAQRAYRAAVAKGRAIQGVWSLLAALLTRWDVTHHGEPLPITPVTVGLLGPLVAPLMLQAVANDITTLAQATLAERRRMITTGRVPHLAALGPIGKPVA